MNCQICCLPGLVIDDICECCGWHQDIVCLSDGYSSANGWTVEEASRNFEQYGACDEHARSFLKPDRQQPSGAALIRAAMIAGRARAQALRMLALQMCRPGA